MSWMWFALVDDADVRDADAAARATWSDGTRACMLAAWAADRRPKVRALKIDARMIQTDGGAVAISLVLAPPRVRLLFDDAAVQQARRDVLAGRPSSAISTLLQGDSIFAGAVTVEPAGDDPFARIFPARRLRVESGIFGPVPAHPGPDIERHGSGAPWPFPRFDVPPGVTVRSYAGLTSVNGGVARGPSGIAGAPLERHVR